MSNNLRAAAKAALLALKCLDGLECAREEIENLEAALAEQEQEPVAYIRVSKTGNVTACAMTGDFYKLPEKTLLYPAPPRREWAGLTDGEILRLYKEHAKYQEEGMKLSGWNTFAADVQAKLREKNT